MQSARLLRALHGQNAKKIAMERANELQASGNFNGAIKWLRVMERVIAIDESNF